MSDAKQLFIDEVMRLARLLNTDNDYAFAVTSQELKAFMQERIGEPVYFSIRQPSPLYRLDGGRKDE